MVYIFFVLKIVCYRMLMHSQDDICEVCTGPIFIGIVFFKAIPMAPDTRWLQRRREEDRQGGGEKEEREDNSGHNRAEQRGEKGKMQSRFRPPLIEAAAFKVTFSFVYIIVLF